MKRAPIRNVPLPQFTIRAILLAAIASPLCHASAILETGGGTSLISGSQPLLPVTAPPTASIRLEFEFGFSTDDSVQPSTFADSFTVSLQNSQGQRLYVLSADAGGSLWAPAVPGAVPISATEMAIRDIDLQAGFPAHAVSYAYRVEVPVPAEWQNQPLSLQYDLFDNRNDRQSFAYLIGASLVPEPDSITLAGTALAVALAWLATRDHLQRRR